MLCITGLNAEAWILICDYLASRQNYYEKRYIQ